MTFLMRADKDITLSKHTGVFGGLCKKTFTKKSFF